MGVPCEPATYELIFCLADSVSARQSRENGKDCKFGELVSKNAKLVERILHGSSDADIGFDELGQFLLRLGFVQRVRGSHHIFRMAGIDERINLQRDGKNAKPYQVRQVRSVILKYGLQERGQCTNTKP